MTRSTEDLARELVRLRRKGESRTPQLIHSTIEAGAVPIRAEGGQIAGYVGQQYDGTFGAFTVAGPTPPTPTGLTVESLNGSLRITWGGTFEGDAVAPMDWLRCEVSISTDPAFSGLLMGPLDTSIESPRGGTVDRQVDYDTDYYVRLVARSAAGKPSTASAVVGPVRATRPTAADLDVDFEGLRGTKVHYGATTPTGAGGGDLWLKEISPGPPPQHETWRLVGSTWTKLLDQDASAALAAAIAAQQAADAKAKIFYQVSKPTWSGAAGTAVWFDTDAGNAQFSWNGTDFVPRLLGNGSIAPQSLIASELFVTGSVSASLLEAVLLLASEVIVGPPTGEHIRIDPDLGVVAYANDPVDGVPDEVGRFGRNAGGRDPATGKSTWNVDNQGNATFNSLSSQGDIRVGGRLLLTDTLANAPDGWLFGSINIPALGAMTSVETGLYEMAFTAQPGRAYRIQTTNVNVEHTVHGGKYALVLHLTDSGSRPNLSSPVAAWSSGSVPIGNAPWEAASVDVKTIYINNTTSSKFVQMLLTLTPQGGGSVNIFKTGNSGFYLWVEDIGPARGNEQGVGMVNNMTSTVAAPASTAPRDQTTDFIANWTRTWREDGGIQGDGYAEQGFYSGKGNTRSMIGFPDMVPTLSGATIRRVQIYLKNSHWYDGDGGTAVLKTHGWGSLPNSFSQNAFPNGFSVPGWPRYEERWFDAPADWATGVKDGSIRGLTLGPAPSNASEYYGRFEGSGSPFNKPTIRVTYTA